MARPRTWSRKSWRDRGFAFMEEREAAFWSAIGDSARAYLHRRGLRDVMCRARRVGFQPCCRRFEQAKDWGFPNSSDGPAAAPRHRDPLAHRRPAAAPQSQNTMRAILIAATRLSAVAT